jgi:hypothetical protein
VNGQLKNKYGDAFIRGNNGERSFRFEPSSWIPLIVLPACCLVGLHSKLVTTAVLLTLNRLCPDC